jgi:glycosyltransferase involved in cell wall biosynthesis
MNTHLRVCIDARDVASRAGGTATLVISLARALSNLSDGEEQYHFLVKPGDGPHLEGLLQKPLHIIEYAEAPSRGPSLMRRMAARIPFAREAWRLLRGKANRSGIAVDFSVPLSDGTIEREKIDVMHFTTQRGFLTDIPFIYQPHDLQHRHLPKFFTPREYSLREIAYSTLCERATAICVVSKWGKQDLVDSYNVPESKVRVVQYAPDPHNCSQNISEITERMVRKFAIPQRFIFYPARTWPHKNHLRLLQALKSLQDGYGLTVPLVCTGEPTESYDTLKAEALSLGVLQQIYFLGYVDMDELSSLYQLCSAVIIPTLFEAGSFPLWEAFLAGKPAACSNVTSLPAQAGNAALIFDPYKVEEIADAIKRLWNDSDLCASLVARGHENLGRYSWDRTARTFRAIYRKLGNRELTDEDEMLLSAPPLM